VELVAAATEPAAPSQEPPARHQQYSTVVHQVVGGRRRGEAFVTFLYIVADSGAFANRKLRTRIPVF
jgi:hypothetical protein